MHIEVRNQNCMYSHECSVLTACRSISASKCFHLMLMHARVQVLHMALIIDASERTHAHK